MAKKIVITGASGGFGQLIVQRLLADGHEVAGTTRAAKGKNAEVVAKLEQAGTHIIEMDITNDKSVEQGINKAIELLGGLDVVINNAGIGVWGMQEHFTPDDLKYLFDVNVVGVQRVNRAALPHLRQKHSGLLVHISSLLGRITLPFYGPYNATKWALEALVENYRTELSGFGVESAIIEPGGYPTTFMANLMKPGDNSRVDDYGSFMDVPDVMAEHFEDALKNNPEQRPEKVANAVAHLVALSDGQRPFRTIVDSLGMGQHVQGYNESLDQLTRGIYTAYGIEGMLTVNSGLSANQ